VQDSDCSSSTSPLSVLVLSTIRGAVPRAGEVISYQLPTYKLHGGATLYFAGWKLPRFRSCQQRSPQIGEWVGGVLWHGMSNGLS
jgi:hypothetical protein